MKINVSCSSKIKCRKQEVAEEANIMKFSSLAPR